MQVEVPKIPRENTRSPAGPHHSCQKRRGGPGPGRFSRASLRTFQFTFEMTLYSNVLLFLLRSTPPYFPLGGTTPGHHLSGPEVRLSLPEFSRA